MESTRIIWRCLDCDDVVISYSHLRHQMNYCDCGKSAMDLEDCYSRTVGNIENISVKETNDEGKWVKV